MIVTNMRSNKGRAIPNQFIITGAPPRQTFDGVQIRSGDEFQSYKTIIAHKDFDGVVYLDKSAWDYSRTTAKYRNTFLSKTTKEIKALIANGTYKLVELN